MTKITGDIQKFAAEHRKNCKSEIQINYGHVMPALYDDGIYHACLTYICEGCKEKAMKWYEC